MWARMPIDMADPPRHASPVPRIADLDAQALAGLRALDPGNGNRLVQRVVQAFETSAARLLPQLRAAHAAGDASGIHHVAHTLKSSSASVGALSLSRHCAELEALARAGHAAALGPQVAALIDEVDAALQALRRLPEAFA